MVVNGILMYVTSYIISYRDSIQDIQKVVHDIYGDASVTLYCGNITMILLTLEKTQEGQSTSMLKISVRLTNTSLGKNLLYLLQVI